MFFPWPAQMQWRGVSSGFEAFEPLQDSKGPALTTSLEHGVRDVIPTQKGASYIDRVIDVGRQRKTWNPEPVQELPKATGGVLRPLWEAQTLVKERKTSQQSLHPVPQTHVPVHVLDRFLPPVVEKPHMQRSIVEMRYEVPQFSGYGAFHALPTEYVEKPGLTR